MADKWRDARIARGLCGRCGVRPPLEGVKYCAECKARCAREARVTRATHDETLKASDRLRAYRRKVAVIERYGGKCACCGETEPAFLAIDHINGQGNAHRREMGNRGGQSFYLWLKREGYPEGYRVLCHNCNMARSILGICPHRRLRVANG